MKKRLQNKIAESNVTLPTACVVATLLWWLPQGGYSTDYLWGWLACAVTAYLIIWARAANALLRIRSRMISSLYLLLMAACGFLHPLGAGSLIQLCMAFSFFCLLRTYEKPRPEVDTLHVYFFLSLASLLWAPLLLLTPVLFWNQAIFLRSLQGRSFGAALFGLLLPYASWGTYAFVIDEISPLVEHLAGVLAPFRGSFEWQWAIDLAQTTDWEGFREGVFTTLQARMLDHLPESAAFIFLLLLGLTGFIHYLRKSYDDKIRVRMCHYCYMAMQLVVLLWVVLVPKDFHFLFPLLLLTTVPSAAHFVALTRTWMTNLWVVLLTLGLVAVGVCCLAPSLLAYA